MLVQQQTYPALSSMIQPRLLVFLRNAFFIKSSACNKGVVSQQLGVIFYAANINIRTPLIMRSSRTILKN
jgi:hypothetical protein